MSCKTYLTIPNPKLTIMTNIRAKLRLTQEINSATTIATFTRTFRNKISNKLC